MSTNWQTADYFSLLMQRDKRSHGALEMLVDDLHANRDCTIARFLAHTGSEDFLWGIIRLLGNSNSRVAGNAAYILGTIAESEAGAMRVISLTSSMHRESKGILMDLTNMLLFDDSESVMNAAGTMGTLAESFEGRNWMLQEPCLVTTIQNVTSLLISDNLWTASNAALVLARLTIAEDGCQKILEHRNSENILSRLVASLGVDEAGRGMNAAFAIGRLCDMEAGRSRLLALPESEKMITSLAKMLSCSDPGASKNSCFALSCLATSNDGHRRLLMNSNSDDILRTLSELLFADDSETGWFSAMTLKTLASQIKGCLRLRDNYNVLPALKSIDLKPDINSDLRDEVTQTLEILRKLAKPQPPGIEVCGSDEVHISWDKQTTKLNLLVSYHVFQDGDIIYDGIDNNLSVKSLAPAHQYSFRTRAYAEGDEGIVSEPTVVTTDESVPSPPMNVRVLGATTTQLKIGWDPPAESNGILKNYYTYNGEKYHECTSDLTSIISGLQPNTAYEVHVAASTAKGKGPKESITGTTTEMGAHAPSKPEVIVRGRNEINISWKAPVVPLGRISRYEVCMNGEVIYSGMDLHYVSRRLKPDTEYAFVVSAITSEGKCESKMTKKRSAKDEYEGERAPLYQNPNKKDLDQKSEEKKDDNSPKTLSKKRKSISFPQEGRPRSPVRKNSASSVTRQSQQESRTPTPLARDPVIESQKRTKSAGPRYKFGYSHSGHVKLPNVRTDEPRKPSPPSPPPAVEVKPLVPPPSPPTETSAQRKPDPTEKSETRRLKVLAPMASASSWDYTARPSLLSQLSQEMKPVALKNGKKSDSEDVKKVEPKPSVQLRPKPVPRRNSKHTSGNSELQWRQTHRRASNASSHEKQNFSSVKTHHGNDILSVEIDKRLRPNVDSGSTNSLSKSCSYAPTESKLLSRRGSLHSYINADFIDSEPSSMSSVMKHAESAASIDAVTRTFSTLQSANAFKPSPSQYVKPGFIEFEACNALSAGQPPPHVQRANTFIASHRSSSKRKPNQRRASLDQRSSANSLLSIQANNSTAEWKPDIPSAVTIDRKYSKFVPMQFRTQPANLPRQPLVAHSDHRGTPQLESLGVLSRSRTDVRLSSPPDGRAAPPPSSHHVTPLPKKKSLSANLVRSNISLGASSLQNGDHLEISTSDPIKGTS